MRLQWSRLTTPERIRFPAYGPCAVVTMLLGKLTTGMHQPLWERQPEMRWSVDSLAWPSNLPVSKGRPARIADNLTAICKP
jgi:hypothetical protein